MNRRIEMQARAEMPFMERDDLEMSYRRGYERGAAETFEAVERLLDPRTREIVRAWIEKDVHGWRRKAMLGRPPIWRLAGLRAAREA
jgi:hypothetical protein